MLGGCLNCFVELLTMRYKYLYTRYGAFYIGVLTNNTAVFTVLWDRDKLFTFLACMKCKTANTGNVYLLYMLTKWTRKVCFFHVLSITENSYVIYIPNRHP